MQRDGWYLLVYDIEEDRMRTRVAKVAEGYGVRVQKSAFECRLTRGMRERLLAALAKTELGEGDRLSLYRLAPGRPRHFGAAAVAHPQSEDRHAIIL
jgi:CRISPR-associated protein Cas2